MTTATQTEQTTQQASGSYQLNPIDQEWPYEFGIDGLMRLARAAEFLGVSRWTAATLCDEGKLRRRYDGRNCFICRRSIMDFIAQMSDRQE